MCVHVGHHPKELLRVFDEEGHAAVQLVQVVFQVDSVHLQQDTTQRFRSKKAPRRVPEEHPARPRPLRGTQSHMSGPEDVRREHEGQVEGRHLVPVLVPGGVVEQVQQQPEQRAVGLGQQLEQQLQRLHLPLLVGHSGLVALLVKQHQVCNRQREDSGEAQAMNEEGGSNHNRLLMMVQEDQTPEKVPVHTGTNNVYINATEVPQIGERSCVRILPAIFRCAWKCRCVSRGSGSSPRKLFSREATSCG